MNERIKELAREAEFGEPHGARAPGPGGRTGNERDLSCIGHDEALCVVI
mgnify:CR=1 FL=1